VQRRAALPIAGGFLHHIVGASPLHRKKFYNANIGNCSVIPTFTLGSQTIATLANIGIV